MRAKWKTNKNLKPKVILNKIESIKTINLDGSVSFSGFDIQNELATLFSMIEFTRSTNGLNAEFILFKAISNVAKIKTLEQSSVIEEINSVIKNQLATREHKFHVLTTLSLGKPYPASTIKIDNAEIRLLASDYPKKFSTRYKVFLAHTFLTNHTPPSYAKIIVTLKAKSENLAVIEALRVLDIQRAIWSFSSNSGMELMGSSWKPINKIRLGEAHTIHKENGELAANGYELWFEPNFSQADSFSHNNHDSFTKVSNWILSKITTIPYGDLIKDSLVRYVRALDEKDQNSAFIKLWGALESITSPSQANYDLTVKRASAIYVDFDYHNQVLEHLREYRNSNIHTGNTREDAKTMCYQLQFYFHHLIMFHLRYASQFSNLEEANSFLDLPVSKDELIKRKKLITKAIRFRTNR